MKNKKNIIITGASGQVGVELVRLLESEFNIIRVVRSEKDSESETGYFYCKNLADKDECFKTFDQIINSYKSIDCLINVAGGFDMGEPIENQDWESMFNINFKTTLNASSFILKHMKDNNYGKIINFGSVAGIEGMGMAAPYSASKAAVHNLSKTINLETPQSISSHLLVLSIIDTEVNRQAMPDASFDDWISINSIADKISLIVSNKESDELIYFD